MLPEGGGGIVGVLIIRSKGLNIGRSQNVGLGVVGVLIIRSNYILSLCWAPTCGKPHLGRIRGNLSLKGSSDPQALFFGGVPFPRGSCPWRLEFRILGLSFIV